MTRWTSEAPTQAAVTVYEPASSTLAALSNPANGATYGAGILQDHRSGGCPEKLLGGNEVAGFERNGCLILSGQLDPRRGTPRRPGSRLRIAGVGIFAAGQTGRKQQPCQQYPYGFGSPMPHHGSECSGPGNLACANSIVPPWRQ